MHNIQMIYYCYWKRKNKANKMLNITPEQSLSESLKVLVQKCWKNTEIFKNALFFTDFQLQNACFWKNMMGWTTKMVKSVGCIRKQGCFRYKLGCYVTFLLIFSLYTEFYYNNCKIDDLYDVQETLEKFLSIFTR